jgi:hypothetical protein
LRRNGNVHLSTFPGAKDAEMTLCKDEERLAPPLHIALRKIDQRIGDVLTGEHDKVWGA